MGADNFFMTLCSKGEQKDGAVARRESEVKTDFFVLFHFVLF